MDLDTKVVLSTAVQVRNANLNKKPADALKIGDTLPVRHLLLWGGPGAERAYWLARQQQAQIGAITGLVTKLTKAIGAGGTLTEAQVTAAAEAGAAAALRKLGDALDGDGS